MASSVRSVFLACVAITLLDAASAQQALKDPWVATSHKLFRVDYGTSPGTLVHENPGDVKRKLKALAFEAPDLGTGGGAVRGLIAIDDTAIRRFENGSTDIPPRLLFDAASSPSSLILVTALAVTESGTILFGGVSKRLDFELWELTEVPGAAPLVQKRAKTALPLIDAVYVRAEDVTAGSRLAGGGLLAAAANEILFFPRSSGFATAVKLHDYRSLGLKILQEILTVDLVRGTDTLMFATLDRKLMTVPVSPGPVAKFASLPDIEKRYCQLRLPQLVVRSAGPTSTVVSDGCGQVLRYDFSQANSQNNVPADVVIHDDGFVALALGEGKVVTCPPGEVCPLTSGLTAELGIDAESELLVLELDNLCDPRVAPRTCTGTVDASGNLELNSLLPASIRNALAANGVTIKIPPYLFAARQNGRFGVVFVQADDVATNASATIELDIAELFGDGIELGVRLDFPRPTPVLPLLNQDVAAYAPDNPSLPTVRGFEAAPITIGSRNPMVGALRGFSAVTYGLQHDLYPPGPRAVNGGIPQGTQLKYGSTPRCSLQHGLKKFTPVNAAEQYFVNLAACLFADEETLLKSVIPKKAFSKEADRNALIASLDLVKDKLIKALSGAGPNTGSEAFQAVLTQLDHFDSKLAAVRFVPSLIVYQQELEVRSQVFRFNFLERTYPSLPIKGFQHK